MQGDSGIEPVSGTIGWELRNHDIVARFAKKRIDQPKILVSKVIGRFTRAVFCFFLKKNVPECCHPVQCIIR